MRARNQSLLTGSDYHKRGGIIIRTSESIHFLHLHYMDMPVVPRVALASGLADSARVVEPLLTAQISKSPSRKAVAKSRGSRSSLPLSDDSSSFKGKKAATTAVRTVEPVPPLPADKNRSIGISAISANHLASVPSIATPVRTASAVVSASTSKSEGRAPSAKSSSSAVVSANPPVPIVAVSHAFGKVGRPKGPSVSRLGSARVEGPPLSSTSTPALVISDASTTSFATTTVPVSANPVVDARSSHVTGVANAVLRHMAPSTFVVPANVNSASLSSGRRWWWSLSVTQ